ncbi:MAG: GspE/PulE family protein [Erysipelotrichaceae bacterium]
MAHTLEELLVREKIITHEQLEEVNAIQKQTGQATFYILIDHKFAKEKDVLRILAQSLGMDYLDNLSFNTSPDAIRVFPENLARKYRMTPLKVDEGTLTLATSNPFNLNAIEDIGMILGINIQTILAPKVEIDSTIERLYSKKILDKTRVNQTDPTETTDENDVEGSPIVRIVNNLIMEAYKRNASDIHIEPEANYTRVRLRIDGDLVKYINFDNDMHSLISTRIKIISGLNIAEKRIPQDGSFQFNYEFKKIDIRVSTLPTPYGENIVLRLLGADQNIEYSLAGLGLSPRTLEIIEKAIKVPHGIILVTGPTGSGKTTTLYSILSKLAIPSKAIKTVEDPIERKFEGITQVQVNQKAGLTFAAGLRSILRQDPDIIMIGEIRDGETAEIAIRAAITGHLVLSTIHTNDALSSVVRLVDMGIEPFKVGSSLVCVIAQRLIKRNCIHCKEQVELTNTEKRLLRIDFDHVYKGRGCDKCNQTGYSGRLAAFEIVLVDQKLEELISKNASMETLRAYAIEKKMQMLRDEVIEFLNQGLTSVDEALRVLYNVDN